MFCEADLVKSLYKPGEVAKMLGVTPRSILRYRNNGEIRMQLDEVHNRWYMTREDLIDLLCSKGMLEKSESRKKVIIYARVSSHDQKRNGDLARQIEFIVDECKRRGSFDYMVFSDVASGLNTKRSGLNAVIDAVCGGDISFVYITYRDRLTRFGFEYLECMFKKFGTEIIPLCADDDRSVQEELVDDMMSLLASFSGRLYGLRSSSKRKLSGIISDIAELKD